MFQVYILSMFVWIYKQEQDLLPSTLWTKNHITIFALSFSFNRINLRSSARKASLTPRISYSMFMILFFRFLFSTIRTQLRCFVCCRSESKKNKIHLKNVRNIQPTNLVPRVVHPLNPPGAVKRESLEARLQVYGIICEALI